MVALRLGFLTMQALVRRRRRGVARSVFGDARAEYFNGGEASIAAVLGPASARGLQVIFDFDRTLTASNSSQCHDGLRRVDAAARGALEPYWRFGGGRAAADPRAAHAKLSARPSGPRCPRRGAVGFFDPASPWGTRAS
ncbi:hypothetical protein JL721_9679 [Aureococcus anophagefferens]|nr:hypothetical protein JL721_9679 [Aureococcus anophagefferens]